MIAKIQRTPLVPFDFAEVFNPQPIDPDEISLVEMVEELLRLENGR